MVMLFHMKELQLGLHKYIKIKLSLSIYFFCISKSISKVVGSRGRGLGGEGSRGVWVGALPPDPQLPP